MNMSQKYSDTKEGTRQELIGSIRAALGTLIERDYNGKIVLGGNDTAETHMPNTRAIKDDAKIIIEGKNVSIMPSMESWIYDSGRITYCDTMRKITKEVGTDEIPFQTFKVEFLLYLAENIDEILASLK